MFILFLLVFSLSANLLLCTKFLKIFKKKDQTNSSANPADSNKACSSGSEMKAAGAKGSQSTLTRKGGLKKKKGGSEKKFKFDMKMGGDEEEGPETDLRSVDEEENPLANKDVQAKLRTGGSATETKTEAPGGSKVVEKSEEPSVVLSQQMKMENEPFRANQSIYISTRDVKKSKGSKEKGSKETKEEKKEGKK